MYVRGYLQSSENGRVVTIGLNTTIPNLLVIRSRDKTLMI